MEKLNQKLAILGLMGLMLAAAPGLKAEGEEGNNDQRVRMEAVEEGVEGLTEKLKELGSVKFEGFLNLRYDNERNPSRAYLGEQYQPTVDGTRTNNNGRSGFYARRGEAKWSGRMGSSAIWSLGYDFVENKMKDMGVELLDLPIIPFMDLPEFTQIIRLGQYRMPFGIMPQTSSSAIWFPERSMINGHRLNNNTSLTAPWGVQASVSERVMGIQGRHKGKNSIASYDVQYGAFNNVHQDQTAAANNLAAAFTDQDEDQDLSWAFRAAFEHNYLYSLLPEKSKLQTGASYMRDSRNGNFETQRAVEQMYDEVVGLELAIYIGPQIKSHTEWIHINKNITGNFAGAGVGSRGAGWYSDLALDILPWIASPEKGDALELLARVDTQTGFGATTAYTSIGCVAGGLKWSYFGGKNHTSLTYYSYAPDFQFGGDGRGINPVLSAPETKLVLQQQFAFETGKP